MFAKLRPPRYFGDVHAAVIAAAQLLETRP
jgi:hypothetical protein